MSQSGPHRPDVSMGVCPTPSGERRWWSQLEDGVIRPSGHRVSFGPECHTSHGRPRKVWNAASGSRGFRAFSFDPRIRGHGRGVAGVRGVPLPADRRRQAPRSSRGCPLWRQSPEGFRPRVQLSVQKSINSRCGEWRRAGVCAPLARKGIVAQAGGRVRRNRADHADRQGSPVSPDAIP